MKKIFMVLISCLVGVIAFSQDSTVTEMDRYRSLASQAITQNIQLAKLYVDSMQVIAQETGNERYLLHARYQYGVIHRFAGSYEEAMENFIICKNGYAEAADLAKTFYQIGGIHYHLNELDKAIANYNEARSIAVEVADYSLEFKVLNAIAVIYKNTYQYEKSMLYFREAESKALALGDTASLTVIYNGIGMNYLKMDSLTQAKITFEQGLKIAIQYERINAEAQHSRNLAMIYQEENNLIKAEELHLKALNLRKEIGSKIYIGGSYYDLGLIAIKQGNYKRAATYLDNAEEIITAVGDPSSINMLEEAKSELYRLQGEYGKAMDALERYYIGRDTLMNNELRTKVNEITEKYESSKKDAEIQEQALEIERKTNQRNLLFGGLSSIALIGSTLIWSLLSRNRKNRQLASQKQVLSEQKIETLEKEKQIMSMSSMLEGQESERIRIAKDLHDGLGGLLTSAKVQIGKIQQEIEKVENLDIYNKANVMIDKAHEEVRRISHNLMPGDLRAGGLGLAVRQLVHEMNTIHDIKTELEVIGLAEQRLKENVELSIYRIIQELLNNIIKHAKASKVFVQLSKFEKEINVVIEDNGIGFEFNEVIQKGGLGLRSILSRVKQLKGDIDVNSNVNDGSSITINVAL